MITMDAYGTFVVASMVLIVGRLLVTQIEFLRAYSLPEPVVGGLMVALGIWLFYGVGGVQINFDRSLSVPLMLSFFACIGLNADLASLQRGGKPMIRFLVVVVGFLVLQNIVGVMIALILGQPPLLGLLAGSITLSGGHGTGLAWGEIFTEKYGLSAAKEIGMASATIGLVLGGLLGGPVARFLLSKLSKHIAQQDLNAEPMQFEQPSAVRLITAPSIIETLALISICLLTGQAIARELSGSWLELPSFVCVLFVGVLLRNTLSFFGCYAVFERAVSVVGNVALALFLAMALMTLQLWELTNLALPMFGILLAQVALMVSYAVFVTFPVMGRDYNALVIAAGHCGFGLGATPTAIANMQAVTDRFGISHLGFLIVPIVGAFFIDLANALVIKTFLFLPFMR